MNKFEVREVRSHMINEIGYIIYLILNKYLKVILTWLY